MALFKWIFADGPRAVVIIVLTLFTATVAISLWPKVMGSGETTAVPAATAKRTQPSMPRALSRTVRIADAAGELENVDVTLLYTVDDETRMAAINPTEFNAAVGEALVTAVEQTLPNLRLDGVRYEAIPRHTFALLVAQAVNATFDENAYPASAVYVQVYDRNPFPHEMESVQEQLQLIRAQARR